jgi:hypothetical protein
MADVVLHNEIVYGVDRCPHCGVSRPLLTKIGEFYDRQENKNHPAHGYFTAKCSFCTRLVLMAAYFNASGRAIVTETFPENVKSSPHIPDKARNYLEQALATVHAPDGSVMLAASSVDAMLKEKGFVDGDLYPRIEKAFADGILTSEMRDWSHEIRLSANLTRHADVAFTGMSESDALQCIEFAKALAQYLFVLPANVRLWKEKATKKAAA